MTRRGRYLIWSGMVLVVTTMATVFAPLATQSASRFANTAFETQWQTLERSIPNFYGPLSTAFDPSTEPYMEGIYNGQSGVRLVQYFDKARLEQITPDRRITSGLLTVELKSGNLQLGNATFAQYPPAYIGVAGDPGGGGPTYADLQQLPEQVTQANGAVNLRFEPSSNTFAPTTASSDPQAAFAEYIADPNGRFGQNVPRAFADFLRRIPGGSLPTMGYPIGPAFTAHVRLKGVNNTAVIVQPFQRRVLTYTPSNREATRVEFGNIGRHYYQWRSSLGSAGMVFPPPFPPPVFVTNTPGPTATNTPGAISPEDATVTAVVNIATNAAASATAAQNLQTATAVSAAATGTSQTATAAVVMGTAAVVQATTTTLQTQTAAIQQTATALANDSGGQTAATIAAQTSAAGMQNAIAALTAAPATATQISLEQTGAAVAYATQTAVASMLTAAAGGTPGSQRVQQQAFRPQRTPAASARI